MRQHNQTGKVSAQTFKSELNTAATNPSTAQPVRDRYNQMSVILEDYTIGFGFADQIAEKLISASGLILKRDQESISNLDTVLNEIGLLEQQMTQVMNGIAAKAAAIR